MLKLLHCADLHLDSPFRDRDPESSARRRRELRRVFSSLVDFVKAESIPLVLLVGDLFDGAAVTSETVSFVKEALASVPDCRFVIAPGNHDPHTPDSVYAKDVFPSNVYIFHEPTLTSFDFPELNVTVYGYAFPSASLPVSPLLGARPTDLTRINLLAAHAEIGNPLSPYAPISESDIAATGFDYCAFGHVHAFDGIKKAGQVPYAYSGCLVGRDFGETGHKGALVLDVTKEHCHETFVDFSPFHYECRDVDVSGISEGAELRAKLEAALAEEDEHTLLRLTLRGSVLSQLRIDTEALTEAFASGLAYLEIEDMTLPLLDLAYLQNDPTIVGAFFAELRPLLEQGTAEERLQAARALRIGLAALHGEDVGEIG